MYAHQLFFTISILVKCFISEANPLSSSDESGKAYHWRDYNGNLPSDAFIAAVNNDGNPMYVAQVLHVEFLIPGFISAPDFKEVIYQMGNEERRTLDNVKILCADDPNKLEWIESNTSDFVIDEKYIVGGFDFENKVFIGKSFFEGERVLGKVPVHKYQSDPVFFHTTRNGNPIRLKNFQVLSFVRHHRTTIRDDYELDENWSTLTSDGWFQRTSRPYVQDESPIAISGNVKSLTISDDKKCTCGKGTVIINFY